MLDSKTNRVAPVRQKCSADGGEADVTIGAPLSTYPCGAHAAKLRSALSLAVVEAGWKPGSILNSISDYSN